MRTYTRLTLAALALTALAAAARAQETDTWISISPGGERFVVKAPSPFGPARELRLTAGELKVEGRRYGIAGADGNAYLVLSLRDNEGVGERLAAAGYPSERFRRESRYLDEIAGLAREALARPAAETPDGEGALAKIYPSLSYRREFELGGRAAREYFVSRWKEHGPVYVCADGPQIYVIAALGADPRSADLKRFVDSFELSAERATPAIAGEAKADPAAAGAGVGPGRGSALGGEAGHGPFTSAEVSEKARITSKPEPLYTEDARKFQVAGTVRVRVTLSAAGEVERVEVEKGLPHGMTLAAVEAARKISFEPARKDGRPVAQFALIEYNFNIY
jgi:TonB family protein